MAGNYLPTPPHPATLGATDVGEGDGFHRKLKVPRPFSRYTKCDVAPGM